MYGDQQGTRGGNTYCLSHCCVICHAYCIRYIYHTGTHTYDHVSLMWSRLRVPRFKTLLAVSLLFCLRLLFLFLPFTNLFFTSEAVVSLSYSAPGLLILIQVALDKEIPGVLQKNSRETRHNGSHAFNNHIRQGIVPQVPPATL